jgi:uncharacterized protein YqeY
MDLKTQIEQDFLTAYKAKNEMEISVLRMVKSAFKNTEIALGHSLSEDETIKVLKKEVKQREESATEFAKNDRADAAAKEKAEAEILRKYLPAELSEDKIATDIDNIITEIGATGPSDMGKVMGAAMKHFGASADGSIVSRLVKEKLNR